MDIDIPPEVLKRYTREGLVDMGWWKSCVNCAKFLQMQEVCTHDGCLLRPPAKVILFGCDAFEEIIPF